MKTGRTFGIVAAALVACMAYTPAAQAQSPFPAKAKAYKTDLARAMDQCVSGITVVNPGAIAGCAQANVITDAAVTGAIAGTLKVAIKKGSPVVTLKGKGFTPAATQLGVQLTIRSSSDGYTPAGSKTYSDVTVTCGSTAGGMCGNYFTSDADGKVKGTQTLADCLTANGLSTLPAVADPATPDSRNNIEITDAAVVNCATGKVIAVPGIVQK